MLGTLVCPMVSTENARFQSFRCFEFKSTIIFKALKVEKWRVSNLAVKMPRELSDDINSLILFEWKIIHSN